MAGKKQYRTGAKAATRARSYKRGQERKELRRLANTERAATNKELRKQGLPTPSDKWVECKERARAARARRAEQRRNAPRGTGFSLPKTATMKI